MTFFNPYRKKGNPFGRKRVEKAGISFDSKAESRLHDELLLQEKAGELEILKLQDRVHLVAGIHTIVDFKVFDKVLGQVVWVEMKGFETPEWRLKKRLWKVFGPGRLRIYYGKGKVEEITPSGAVQT
jgi:hypothetical protein